MITYRSSQSELDVHILDADTPSQAGISVPEAINDKEIMSASEANKIIERKGNETLPRIRGYAADPAAPTWSKSLERKYLWEAIMVLQGADLLHFRALGKRLVTAHPRSAKTRRAAAQ